MASQCAFKLHLLLLDSLTRIPAVPRTGSRELKWRSFLRMLTLGARQNFGGYP